MKRVRMATAAAALLLVVQASANVTPRIAIIIDDLGYQLEAGRRAILLPGPVAYAILPRAPESQRLAEFANARGKEVLLHLPLEAMDHSRPAEPGSIVLDMSRAAVSDAFNSAIDSVPYAIGVSSHRGSLLTRHPGHMSWLMQDIAHHGGLFFIDSYTTHHSVALRMAEEAGIAARRRDVFLDHDRSPAALLREFERLKHLARKRGKAIAIGHPYPETLEMLETELDKLEQEGIELVPVSQLIS